MGGKIRYRELSADFQGVSTNRLLFARQKKRGALRTPRNHVIQEEESYVGEDRFPRRPKLSRSLDRVPKPLN
jgi:hypothetical protein